MGSQKIPGMVLHCNGRTHGNAYLLTSTVGPLPHRTWRCCEHRRKASLGIFQSSAVVFNSMSSMVVKRVPLRHVF
jgi:hypothetical protein